MSSALFFLSPLPSHARIHPLDIDSGLAKPMTYDHQQQRPQLRQQSHPFLSSSQLLSADQEEVGALLDEVWTFVNKYYIDRSFHGLDWAKVKQIYRARLQNNKNIDEMKLAREMVQSLGDKYTRLLDTQQYAAIQKYDLIGVGVTLMPDAQLDIVVGAPPIADSAADKAGLRVGDKVLAVNGVSTKGKTAFDIIDQLSENPNSKTVTMTIQSAEDPTRMRDAIMERQFQEIKNPIRSKITETRKDGTKVGYIRISEFNSLIKANLGEALSDLKRKGANAFVVDLRMNGGGAFQSAVEVSSFFVEDRVATYVVDGTTTLLPFKTAKNQVLVGPNDPVVLWVDGGSASAAEVLAASLHDNCRAVIMGDKSFGKGLIQAVYGLKNGAGLVLTVARYVTPNQGEIQGVGIQPDILGANLIPSPLLPGPLGTDTSRIDFADVMQRLSPTMCSVPEPQQKLIDKT